jgi:hypothetical protein
MQLLRFVASNLRANMTEIFQFEMHVVIDIHQLIAYCTMYIIKIRNNKCRKRFDESDIQWIVWHIGHYVYIRSFQIIQSV